MRFDLHTLLGLLLIQSLALAALPALLLGWCASPGARRAQAAIVAQAAGWALLLAPLPEQARLASTAALGLLSASLTLLWLAIAVWLPGRLGRWLQLAMPLLVVVGHGAGWENAGFRIAWSHGCLGLQMLAVAAALLQPVKRDVTDSRRWRLMVALSLGLLGLMALARAGVEGLPTAPVAAPGDGRHPLTLAVAVLAHVGLLAVALGLVVAWRGESESELRRQSQTDGATGLANRRGYEHRSVDMISMARRYDEPLMLLLFDLDGLKAFNAAHGEACGDAAIALFARCLDEQKRLGDLVARIDGQRFAVLMARSDLVGPPALDRRLRQALQAQAPRALGQPLSFSAGWAKLRAGDRGIDDLQRRAEIALYSAKRQGRDRLCAEPGLEAELSAA